jgi:hypothetical protein
MGEDEETEIVIQSLNLDLLKTNEIKLRSGATSLFDVQRWVFDVRHSVCSRMWSWQTIAAILGWSGRYKAAITFKTHRRKPFSGRHGRKKEVNNEKKAENDPGFHGGFADPESHCGVRGFRPQ